jgi:hypothetical protein
LNLSDNEEGKNNSGNAQLEEFDNNFFYVDTYSEEQIKEMIAIFKNDYKPPKNLWIEK